MRIAAIRFINALPLIYGLEKNPSHQFRFETPSNCYRSLLSRYSDLALIPIFGTQTSDQIYAFPELGIAAEKSTESVFLFSQRPPQEIRSIATDPASLTSTTLLKIILQKMYANSPTVVPNTYQNISEALQHHDAVLVIGDGAILANRAGYHVLDLASEWHSFTGLPFVFAIWASDRPLDDPEKNELLESYDRATQNWDEIYERAARALNLDVPFLKRYYNYDLHYRLTKQDHEGFRRFIELASELEIIKNPRDKIWM